MGCFESKEKKPNQNGGNEQIPLPPASPPQRKIWQAINKLQIQIADINLRLI